MGAAVITSTPFQPRGDATLDGAYASLREDLAEMETLLAAVEFPQEAGHAPRTGTHVIVPAMHDAGPVLRHVGIEFSFLPGKGKPYAASHMTCHRLRDQIEHKTGHRLNVMRAAVYLPVRIAYLQRAMNIMCSASIDCGMYLIPTVCTINTEPTA
jgi:hypothetical protein